MNKLRAIAAAVVVVLFVRVFVLILLEYRWYFPPDFELSAFLGGRRYSFVGTYRTGFYVHIISGPFAILLACFLMLTGGLPRFRRLHRWAGRTQALLVMAIVVPSGLVMANQAYAGPIAGLGFALLSVATGVCVVAAARQARARKFQSHRRWATRCFILLCSPLLLRVISGAVITLNIESDWSYRLNAWLSWLIPLMIYETWWRRSESRESGSPLSQYSRAIEKALP